MLTQEYKDFVTHKAAPYRQLSAAEFHVMHAAFGLATELLELTISHTSQNTEEELGDLLWYITLLDNAISPQERPEIPKIDTNAVTLKTLQVTIEYLVSEIKKVVIYGNTRHLDVAYSRVYVAFVHHCMRCNMTIEYLMASNMEKLNARYKAKFDAQEAEARADKV